MNYAFKLTTNGRRVLAALGTTEQPLQLTRVEVGDGAVPEGTDLADLHQLVHPVTEGTIGDRSHENDRLTISVQYSNAGKTDVKTFYLSEFLIYAVDPETGEETDLIYGTLGDYRQPVPAYVPGLPASVWNFPLVVVVSSEVEVRIDAPAGLVTYDALAQMLGSSVLGVYSTEVNIPGEGWAEDADTGGAYALCADIELPAAAERLIPIVTIPPGGMDAAMACGLAAFARTLEGAVRVYAQKEPGEPIRAGLALLGMLPTLTAD